MPNKNDATLESLSNESEGQLAIDVYQTPSEIIVESTVAGVRPDELDVDITNESVTIRGERKREEKVVDENYLYQECYWGRFSRSIILPQDIDPDKAQAEFKNGILRVRLPKIDRTRSKKLKIKGE